MIFSIQAQQFTILSILLILAKLTAYLYLGWTEIILILIVAMGIEHMMLYLKHKTLSYLSFSAFSTALGIVLMMYATHLGMYMIVLVLALLQKHLLTYKGRHFFNPSNFALMMALLFFYEDAHIVLGQLGEALWFEWLVILLAMTILIRAQRWIIPIVFVLSYLLFQKMMVLSGDPTMLMEDIYLRFYSISFILFISFMLTDPRTTPTVYTMQILFAVGIALGATLLDYWYGFRVQHLFLILFLFTFLFVSMEIIQNNIHYQKWLLAALFFWVILVIIYIQAEAPYYVEMYG